MRPNTPIKSILTRDEPVVVRTFPPPPKAPARLAETRCVCEGGRSASGRRTALGAVKPSYSTRSRMRLCLVPLWPKHKDFNRCADIAAPLEHRGHLRGNRQFYAVARSERKRRGR